MSGDTIFFIAVIAVAVTSLTWMFFALVKHFETSVAEHEEKLEARAEQEARERAEAAEAATTTGDAEASSESSEPTGDTGSSEQ